MPAHLIKKDQPTRRPATGDQSQSAILSCVWRVWRGFYPQHAHDGRCGVKRMKHRSHFTKSFSQPCPRSRRKSGRRKCVQVRLNSFYIRLYVLLYVDRYCIHNTLYIIHVNPYPTPGHLKYHLFLKVLRNPKMSPGTAGGAS